MKSVTIAVFFAAFAVLLVSAQPHLPHGHRHRHPAKREPSVVTVDSTKIAYEFELNGEVITQNDVCNGIADGSLKWEGDAPPEVCGAASSLVVSSVTPTPSSTTSTQPSTTATPTSTTSAEAAEFYQESSSSSSAAPVASTSTAAAPVASPAESASSSSSSGSSSGSDLANYSGLFTSALAQDSYPDFPDGEISCSDGPPTKYGAVPVPWLGMQGWTTIQLLSGNAVTGDGTECVDGASCSYSCAPGWQKTQWIEDQPSNGVSIGGLLCKGGKLYLANSNPQICGPGVGGVSVTNKASGPISVCRTDYPGNEGEGIPLDVAVGATEPMTCPDETSYYQHLGDATSAEYYLNPISVGSNPGCSWGGTGSGNTGNSAPIVLGVGYTDGMYWVSIQQNSPTYMGAFEGTVTLTGDGLSAPCTYSNGQYCQSGKCVSHDTDGAGCTSASSNPVTYVVSD